MLALICYIWYKTPHWYGTPAPKNKTDPEMTFIISTRERWWHVSQTSWVYTFLWCHSVSFVIIYVMHLDKLINLRFTVYYCDVKPLLYTTQYTVAVNICNINIFIILKNILFFYIQYEISLSMSQSNNSFSLCKHNKEAILTWLITANQHFDTIIEISRIDTRLI